MSQNNAPARRNHGELAAWSIVFGTLTLSLLIMAGMWD
jgi:hypothetical protein